MVIDVVYYVLVIGFEMFGGVVGELVFGVVIDGDVVVILEVD